MNHKGQPTVILAKTVKGFGLGKRGEGQNGRAPAEEARRRGAARSSATASTSRSPTSEIAKLPFVKPAEDSAGDEVPARAAQGARRLSAARARSCAEPLRDAGARARSAPCSKARGDREISHHDGVRAHPARCCSRTRTSARTSCRSCPTRRAPSAWKACSARSASTRSAGQLYTPQDSDQLMSYREDKKGQMLEEGINEAGSHLLVDRGRHRLREPRRQHGAVLHLLLDVRLPARRRFLSGPRATCSARGFLLGGTAGRTTLAGEGLQHQDGHSQLHRDHGAELRAPTTRPTPTSSP